MDLLKFDKALIENVIEEIKIIKEYAKKEEIERLEEGLCEINPSLSDRCIYGLMTGNCNSERSLFLMNKREKNVYYEKRETLSTLEFTRKKITFCFSPLEKILLLIKEKNNNCFKNVFSFSKNVLKMLKGELEIKKENLIL